MTGTRGPPDRSRSTWVDAELSCVQVPHGQEGAAAHGDAAVEERAWGLPGHHLLMDALQSISHHLGKGPG